MSKDKDPARERYRQARSAHWDAIACKMDTWKGWGRYYHRRIQQVCQFLVSPGQRVLEVGCAQGELAWSLAMELDDYEHQNDKSTGISIVASDSMAKDIDKARSASYDEMELEDLGEGFRKLYFAPADNGSGFTVKNRIRNRVEFSQCDLLKGCRELGQFNVILCPEVLAYLSNGVRAAVLSSFAGMLKPGGMLIVGSQQHVPPSIGLERVNHPAGVFYRHH